MSSPEQEKRGAAELAVIGGSGLDRIDDLTAIRSEFFDTPFGKTSAPLTFGELAGQSIVFLPRHGVGHTVPPHKINYRANLWALRQLGVQEILAVAAVGGIRSDLIPGSVAIPDQIIDYTCGREHSYFVEDLKQVTHIDFTYPYCESLREQLIDVAQANAQELITNGTYGATQGPRLESAAEVKRLEQDGCDMVGMTGMPEAALARELNLCYACCAVVANWAAGKSHGTIQMDEIEANLVVGMNKFESLLIAFLRNRATARQSLP